MKELKNVLDSEVINLITLNLWHIGTLHLRDAYWYRENSVFAILNFVIHQVSQARDEVGVLYTHYRRNGENN